MADPKEFSVKTREQIRSDYTRTIKAGLQDIGIANPNVSEGSLDYLRGDALGEFGEQIGNLVQIKANAQMPDTAGKEDPEELARIARLYKLSLRPAGPSIGNIIIETSVNSPISMPTGAQLIDDAGLLYEVTSPGPYANLAPVPTRSIDTGEATNLEAGTTLRWTNPPPFVLQTCKVAPGGFTGGVNEENIEGLRERLLAYYANPPGGGNWAQVAMEAESSSTFVSRAFVYPAIYGGNTLHVVVVAAPTATNKTRVVDQTVVNQVVGPTVIGKFPTFADIVVTSVVDYPINMSISLVLPTSKRASPPGPGGGWIDGTPWPTPAPAETHAKVITVYSAYDIVVRSSGVPTIGTHVCYISNMNMRLYRSIIVSATQPDAIGAPYDWRITLDKGLFRNILTGAPIEANDYVFPDAENMSAYVDAVVGAFADLGPTEKTTSFGLLPRALRKPLASYTAPAQLGSFALRRVIMAGEEVFTAAYLLEPATVPVASGYKVAPNIGTPFRIAFYP